MLTRRSTRSRSLLFPKPSIGCLLGLPLAALVFHPLIWKQRRAGCCRGCQEIRTGASDPNPFSNANCRERQGLSEVLRLHQCRASGWARCEAISIRTRRRVNIPERAVLRDLGLRPSGSATPEMPGVKVEGSPGSGIQACDDVGRKPNAAACPHDKSQLVLWDAPSNLNQNWSRRLAMESQRSSQIAQRSDDGNASGHYTSVEIK